MKLISAFAGMAAAQGFGGFSAFVPANDEYDEIENEVTEFEGDFENFDLDAILRQSDTPLAQELLQVRHFFVGTNAS